MAKKPAREHHRRRPVPRSAFRGRGSPSRCVPRHRGAPPSFLEGLVDPSVHRIHARRSRPRSIAAPRGSPRPRPDRPIRSPPCQAATCVVNSNSGSPHASAATIARMATSARSADEPGAQSAYRTDGAIAGATSDPRCSSQLQCLQGDVLAQLLVRCMDELVRTGRGAGRTSRRRPDRRPQRRPRRSPTVPPRNRHFMVPGRSPTAARTSTGSAFDARRARRLLATWSKHSARPRGASPPRASR